MDDYIPPENVDYEQLGEALGTTCQCVILIHLGLLLVIAITAIIIASKLSFINMHLQSMISKFTGIHSKTDESKTKTRRIEKGILKGIVIEEEEVE